MSGNGLKALAGFAMLGIVLTAGCVQVCSADETLGSVTPRLPSPPTPAQPDTLKPYPNPMYVWRDTKRGVTCYLPVAYDNKGPMACFKNSELRGGRE